MTDARTGCPERPLYPPEPREWDEDDYAMQADWLYQVFADRRYEK